MVGRGYRGSAANEWDQFVTDTEKANEAIMKFYQDFTDIMEKAFENFAEACRPV